MDLICYFLAGTHVDILLCQFVPFGVVTYQTRDNFGYYTPPIKARYWLSTVDRIGRCWVHYCINFDGNNKMANGLFTKSFDP